MLRWLIAILFVANVLAFALLRGMFGPLPAAGPREPVHLVQQVRPDALQVAAAAPGQPVVGGPISQPALDAQPLAASGAAAPADASAPASAPAAQ